MYYKGQRGSAQQSVLQSLQQLPPLLRKLTKKFFAYEQEVLRTLKKEECLSTLADCSSQYGFLQAGEIVKTESSQLNIRNFISPDAGAWRTFRNLAYFSYKARGMQEFVKLFAPLKSWLQQCSPPSFSEVQPSEELTLCLDIKHTDRRLRAYITDLKERYQDQQISTLLGIIVSVRQENQERSQPMLERDYQKELKEIEKGKRTTKDKIQSKTQEDKKKKNSADYWKQYRPDYYEANPASKPEEQVLQAKKIVQRTQNNQILATQRHEREPPNFNSDRTKKRDHEPAPRLRSQERKPTRKATALGKQRIKSVQRKPQNNSLTQAPVLSDGLQARMVMKANEFDIESLQFLKRVVL